MRKDKFKKIIENFAELDKKKMRELRRLLQPIAEDFNEEVIRWLETKNYPLRRGEIEATEGGREEWDGRTATQRLHGERTLAAAQYVRLRKRRGENGLDVNLYNDAPQAKYFFPEIAAHSITPKTKKKLVYWAGEPMAWHPPLDVVVSEDVDEDLIPGGVRKRDRVFHPGHEAFEDRVLDIWMSRKFTDRVWGACQAVFEGLTRGLASGL